MSCPTCGATMQFIHGTGRVFWCPGCGTLSDVPHPGSDKPRANSVPALVLLCRGFGETLGPSQSGLWRQLGIADSINPPGSAPVKQFGADPT